MVNNEGISTTDATFCVALQKVYRMGRGPQYIVCRIQYFFIYFINSNIEYFMPLWNGEVQM